MDTPRPKLVIIAGPTASGKTGLAIMIATRFDGEIISADSRQVYKGLDIGTAKVTTEEMNGVPHHLIDIRETQDVYTAADFKRDAADAISHITDRGKLPVIAGGTFFYIDTLLNKNHTPEVPPNEALRVELEKLDTKSLAKKLETLAPNRYLTIDTNNRRRLIRAIEIASTLGYVPEPQPSSCPYDVLAIGIETDKESLRARYKERAESWISDGLTGEIQTLLDQGVTRERLQEIGFEYQLGLALLDGDITEAEFIQQSIEKNWQYAKRQLTWLKRDENIKWYQKDDPEVLQEVERFLDSK